MENVTWVGSVRRLVETVKFVSVPSLPHLDYGPAATDVRQIVAINGTYVLPVGRGEALFGNAGGAVGRLISGWSFSTIASLMTGFPFSPQLGYNPTGSGDTRNPVRPDVNRNFRRCWGRIPRDRVAPPPAPREPPVLFCHDENILNGHVVRHPFGPAWLLPHTRKPGLKNRQAGGSI